MTDREKLVELIHHCTSCEECHDSDIADHLIAHGVIVLPCKVGDTVWIKGYRFLAEIECINITKSGIDFDWAEYERSHELTELWDYGTFEVEDIGKNVFLTREDAEAALKEGAAGGVGPYECGEGNGNEKRSD